jgi:hypothetical protein
MSYLIVLCVAAVETLSLVLLWTALRVSMPRVARPFVACCGLSLGWGAWILVLVLRGPLWMMGVTGSVLALSSAATGFALHLALSDEEEDHDGGAGVAPTVGPEVPGGGGDDEPPWWPEFERQVAAYAARRDRERQPVA